MRSIETLMFWITVLAGAAMLAPCLILPPWIEYQAQLERRRAADAYVAAIERQLYTTKMQIEHLQNDPAYIVRLARREFGDSIKTPGVETILVGPSPDEPEATQNKPAAEASATEAGPEFLPELSEFLEKVLSRYPYAYLFVNERTRPVVIGLSTALLLTAVVLLGRAGLARLEGTKARRHAST